MSDTTDFVRRLRSGDHVQLMVQTTDDGDWVVMKGYVHKGWSTGRIDLGHLGFVIRNDDWTINENIMSIRYLAKETA